ncbi:hypothetical protein ACFT9M_07825 [Micromonospora purpureochromogenes]|uniref:hypothetical protein n=1 Tax=Micromonospora purpureochromogenes TaxID=47872 RepID=UPI003635792E
MSEKCCGFNATRRTQLGRSGCLAHQPLWTVGVTVRIRHAQGPFTYASVLLDAGESVKALSAYLGHPDPGFTLRIYTHLLPTSEDRTRRAIDHAFADDPQTPDGLETA